MTSSSTNVECHSVCYFSALSNENKDKIICFSKAREGSCSNNGHESDSEVDQVSHSTRMSSVVGSGSEIDRVDIEYGIDEVRISFGTTERDCRICQLSLDMEPGNPVELGCSCKNELARAHQQCAETWFRIKKNKICEICNSIAQNIVIPDVKESSQQITEGDTSSTRALSAPVSSNSKSLVVLPYIFAAVAFIIIYIIVGKLTKWCSS